MNGLKKSFNPTLKKSLFNNSLPHEEGIVKKIKSTLSPFGEGQGWGLLERQREAENCGITNLSPMVDSAQHGGSAMFQTKYCKHCGQETAFSASVVRDYA